MLQIKVGDGVVHYCNTGRAALLHLCNNGREYGHHGRHALPIHFNNLKRDVNESGVLAELSMLAARHSCRSNVTQRVVWVRMRPMTACQLVKKYLRVVQRKLETEGELGEDEI